MIKKVAGGVAAVIILFLLVVATRPSEFRVERSIVVLESYRALMEYVGDFRKWEYWSPWEALDPGMKKTFGGEPGRPGATYHWVGNDKVGEGRMTLETPGGARQIRITLEFVKPMASVSETLFYFEPSSAGTKVTWVMRGPQTFAGKALTLFKSMDSMIGPDFEKGLAALKKGAEEMTIPR